MYRPAAPQRLCAVLADRVGRGLVFREVRGHPMPSSALMAPMTRCFVADLEAFADREEVDLIRYSPGERKNDRTQAYLRD